jgi:arylformamidase
MAIVDISRVLRVGTAVWPGDTPYELEQTLDRALGDSVNLTTLTLSAHTGSHTDAPLHFTDAGASIDQLDLATYWGPAQVVTVTKVDGPLFPADFAAYDLSLARRLLVRSTSGELDQGLFPEAYVYPSPELAQYLAGQGIILYGSDAPSMDDQNSKSLDGHNALARHGIAILEWLDLRGAGDGLYELVALPLRIAGGDGSPVRAALRPLRH